MDGLVINSHFLLSSYCSCSRRWRWVRNLTCKFGPPIRSSIWSAFIIPTTRPALITFRVITQCSLFILFTAFGYNSCLFRGLLLLDILLLTVVNDYVNFWWLRLILRRISRFRSLSIYYSWSTRPPTCKKMYYVSYLLVIS